MDPLGFVRDLFGRETPGTVRLHKPVPALLAIQRNARTIRCDGTVIIDDRPIQALCGALAASQRPDSAVQVRTHFGEPVCFIQSFREAARIARGATRRLR
ncbi:MAG TPA: hypothetical protein VGC09_00400 [Rhodopila sp.]